jgi:hypothetical protein
MDAREVMTIDRIPLWGIDKGVGHIVMGGERRGRNCMTWVRTPHSLVSSMTVQKRMPKRICQKCRDALADLVPHTPKAAALAALPPETSGTSKEKP